MKRLLPFKRKVSQAMEYHIANLSEYITYISEPKRRLKEEFKVAYEGVIGLQNVSSLGTVCYSGLFSAFLKIQAGNYLKVDLMYDHTCILNPNYYGLYPKRPRVKLPYNKLVLYISKLNKLYSGVKISLKFEKNGSHPDKLYAVIEFSKDYKNVVLRDILTRIRYIFEEPFSNDLLLYMMSNKRFSLSGLDSFMNKQMIENESTYYATGHYLFSTPKIINSIDYKNYEKNVLEYLKHDSYGELHRMTSHLLSLNKKQ